MLAESWPIIARACPRPVLTSPAQVRAARAVQVKLPMSGIFPATASATCWPSASAPL